MSCMYIDDKEEDSIKNKKKKDNVDNKVELTFFIYVCNMNIYIYMRTCITRPNKHTHTYLQLLH